MAIIINIDVMLAKRKMSVTELAEKVGITMANISILKNGKARAIPGRKMGHLTAVAPTAAEASQIVLAGRSAITHQ